MCSLYTMVSLCSDIKWKERKNGADIYTLLMRDQLDIGLLVVLGFVALSLLLLIIIVACLKCRRNYLTSEQRQQLNDYLNAKYWKDSEYYV